VLEQLGQAPIPGPQFQAARSGLGYHGQYRRVSRSGALNFRTQGVHQPCVVEEHQIGHITSI
jgi:hypothetical protein